MGDDGAIGVAEADAIPRHGAHRRNLHDERRFVTGLEGRHVDRGPSAREKPSLLIEEVNHGDDATERAAGLGILHEASHGEVTRVVSGVTEREQLEWLRVARRRGGVRDGAEDIPRAK